MDLYKLPYSLRSSAIESLDSKTKIHLLYVNKDLRSYILKNGAFPGKMSCTDVVVSDIFMKYGHPFAKSLTIDIYGEMEESIRFESIQSKEISNRQALIKNTDVHLFQKPRCRYFFLRVNGCNDEELEQTEDSFDLTQFFPKPRFIHNFHFDCDQLYGTWPLTNLASRTRDSLKLEIGWSMDEDQEDDLIEMLVEKSGSLDKLTLDCSHKRFNQKLLPSLGNLPKKVLEISTGLCKDFRSAFRWAISRKSLKCKIRIFLDPDLSLNGGFAFDLKEFYSTLKGLALGKGFSNPQEVVDEEVIRTTYTRIDQSKTLLQGIECRMNLWHGCVLVELESLGMSI